MSGILNHAVQRREVYRVAVFYPKGWEKYGGVREFATKEAAMEERRILLSLNHKDVHVWKVVETMVAT